MLLLVGVAAIAAAIWAVPDARQALVSRVKAPFAARERRMEPLSEYVPVPPATPSSTPAPFLPDPTRPPTPREIAAGLDTVEDLAFLPDGRHLVTAGYGDYAIRLWDVEAGVEVQGVRTHRRPSSLVVLPDARVLAADVYGFLRVYPVHDRRLGFARLAPLEGLLGREMAVSPDGRLLATAVVGSYDPATGSSDLFLLSTTDHTALRQVKVKEALRRPAFSPSGRLLAVGSTANTFTVWDLTTGLAWVQTVPRVDVRSDVSSVAFSPDERLLATGHMDSSITIWDVASRRERHNFYVSQSSTWEVAWSPAGDVLATAQQDGAIRLWDPETAKLRAALRGHQKSAREIAFSPDGRRLASYGEDGRVLVWESGQAETPSGAETATATPASPPPSAAPPASLTDADVMRLFTKVMAMSAIPEEQRQRLRQAFGGLPSMKDEDRAAFVASLLALVAVDEIAAGLGQALRAGLGVSGVSADDAERVRFDLERLPEAVPLLRGIEAVGRGDTTSLTAVFTRAAAASLEQQGPEQVTAGLQRLWRQGLGGSGPGDIHVSFLGTRERGLLHVAHPTLGLSRAGIAGSVSLLEVPVVLEGADWKIAEPPSLPEP